LKKEHNMKKLLLTTALIAIPASASAADTAQHAREMLTKVIAAVKADRDVALGKIAKGEGGFKEGELYPFCSRLSDGALLATPAIYIPIGADGIALKDSTGKPYGKEMNDGAKTHKDGEIFEVTYRAPKPGTSSPDYPKLSYMAKVGDLVCGVGYYTGTDGELGTADAAKAMLLKAAAAVKADREVALAQFNKGDGGFRVGDLYPFCSRIRDGKNVAGPVYAPAGTDARTLKDSTGHIYGAEMITGASQRPEGEIFEVNYLAPKPGTTGPEFPKTSYVTKVSDLACGVGYYK
jgi:Single Cache domain 2